MNLENLKVSKMYIKNAIRDEGSTKLYTAFTVNTVDMVYTVGLCFY